MSLPCQCPPLLLHVYGVGVDTLGNVQPLVPALGEKVFQTITLPLAMRYNPARYIPNQHHCSTQAQLIRVQTKKTSATIRHEHQCTEV